MISMLLEGLRMHCNSHLREQNQWKICYEKPRNVIFHPCKHFVCCIDCSISVDSCPICRSPIVQRREFSLGQTPDSFQNQGLETFRADRQGSKLHSDTPLLEPNSQLLSFDTIQRMVLPLPSRKHSSSVSKAIVKGTGERLILKRFRANSRDAGQNIFNDLQLAAAVPSNKYLVELRAVFWSHLEPTAALEFVDMGSLAKFASNIPNKQVPVKPLACMAQQMIAGLTFLNGKDLMHRHVEPKNILVNRLGDVKLSGWFLKGWYDFDDTFKRFPQMAVYLSPERCLGKDYSFNSDIWSVGVVIYELATGKHPFLAQSLLDLFQKLTSAQEPRMDSEKYSEDLCGFIASCLTRDVTKRPDASAIKDNKFLQGDDPTIQDVLKEWISCELHCLG
jgi:serine/threonine protein kinase